MKKEFVYIGRRLGCTGKLCHVLAAIVDGIVDDSAGSQAWFVDKRGSAVTKFAIGERISVPVDGDTFTFSEMERLEPIPAGDKTDAWRIADRTASLTSRAEKQRASLERSAAKLNDTFRRLRLYRASLSAAERVAFDVLVLDEVRKLP